jgi:hypothetical protein
MIALLRLVEAHAHLVQLDAANDNQPVGSPLAPQGGSAGMCAALGDPRCMVPCCMQPGLAIPRPDCASSPARSADLILSCTSDTTP